MLKTKKEEQNSILYLKKYCKEVHTFPIASDESKFYLYTLVLKNLFSFSPFTAQKYYSKKMIDKINDICSRINIDIVHFDTLILAEYRNNLKEIPWILVNHNVESLLMRRQAVKENNPLKLVYLFFQYLKLKIYEKRYCPKSKAVIVVSHQDKQELERIAPKGHYHVIENGVDTGYFCKQALNKKQNILIMIGGWSWMPNHDSFKYFYNKIYPLIKKNISTVKLWIVGANPTQDMINIAARDSSIKIFGLVDDVRPLYEQASVFLVPLRAGGGTRLKILDALSMEKAIVTTSIGCEGIFVKNNIHLLIADTPEMFAEKTLLLLKDKHLNETLGKNGRKLMLEKYDWNLIGPKMEDVYNSVITSTQLIKHA